MPAIVTCPRCQAKHPVPDPNEPRDLRCWQCGHRFSVDAAPMDAVAAAEPDGGSPSRQPRTRPPRRFGWVWILLLVLGIPTLLLLGCCGVGYWWTSGLAPVQLSSPSVSGGLNLELSVNYNCLFGGPAAGETYTLVMKSSRGHTYTAHFPGGGSGTFRAGGFGNIGDDGPFEIWVESQPVGFGPSKRVSNVVTAYGGFRPVGPMHPVGPVGPKGPQGPLFK